MNYTLNYFTLLCMCIIILSFVAGGKSNESRPFSPKTQKRRLKSYTEITFFGRPFFNLIRPFSYIFEKDGLFITYMVCVLLFSCHTSSYMSFLLINIKHLSYFYSKSRINLQKSCCNIFMGSTFAYSKLFSRLSYSSIIIYYVISNIYNPFFNICFQKEKPLHICLYSLCREY